MHFQGGSVFKETIIWHMMPAVAERLVRKSAEFRVDAIIPCLEDGTAYRPEAKEAARRSLVALRSEIDWKSKGIKFYPRINRSNSQYWQDDVRALVPARVDGLIIAKEDSPDRVRDVCNLISEVEEENGIEHGATPVTIMLETALGLVRAYELASADPRVEAIMIGREDLSSSLGIFRRHQELLAGGNIELLYARSAVVAACRAAGKRALDGASMTFTDEDYMAYDCALAARMGFSGKLSAHPKHVEAIRAGFSPLPEDVEIARQMVEGAKEMSAAGDAPVLGVAGLEVTPAVVPQAQLILDRARWAGMDIGA
jgi:citrate lyase subunit beta/citryl-CoA lyase